MKKILLALLTCMSLFELSALDKLKESYLIPYGNPSAPIKITHYFSFRCPHCIELFREDFKKIKALYLEEIYWVFHPIPMDLLTVQGMVCLDKLDTREKRIFLEAILEEMVIDDSDLSVCMMEKAMEIFEKPITQLQDKDYLSQTAAFQDAFLFLKQEEKITAVPSVEINDKLYLKEVPNQVFIASKIEKLLRDQK